MSTENLGEFMESRVLATRQCHHIEYPVDLDNPNVAVWLDCPQDNMSIVLLPTFLNGLMHLELHFFADGQRADPELTRPTNGCIELVMRKSGLLGSDVSQP